MNLKNKNALVGGSSDGIGKAAAIALASAGANVTLVARNPEKLNKVLSELANAGNQEHHAIACDFSDPVGLQQQVESQLQAVGVYHVLVNNTGGPPAGTALDADLAAFDLAFAQHLKCNHLMVQAVVPGMKQANYGRIINVISTSVKQPIDGLGVSNTIRGAVANWAKTLANELGPFGITVNNVLPGATATGRLTAIIQDKAEKTGASIEKVTEQMTQSIPVRRFAAPAEIADAILFLASPMASYINGINLPVDGGRTKSL